MSRSSTSVKRVAVLVFLLAVGAIARQDEREKGASSVVSGQWSVVSSNGQRATEGLPEGQGRDLVLRACVSCHDLKTTVSQRKTAAAWRRTVDEMIRLGTRLTTDEAEVITNYLATRFGPDAAIPNAQGVSSVVSGQWSVVSNNGPGTTQLLPEGPGRDLILQSCVQCHDVGIIISQRKTTAAWRRTVNEMIWRGAPLMADEAEVVINYLVASFAPNAAIPDARK
jgi:cytochrome c5